jgi:phage terminase Nu1 subunit (DNA packaging protein)
MVDWPVNLGTEDVADLLGVSPRWVLKLTQQGLIPKKGRGVFDAKEVVRAYIDVLKKGKEPKAASGDDDLLAHKTRFTKAKADSAEMEAARLSGRLIPAEDVADTWGSLASNFRARMLALPNAAAPQLLTAVDQAAVVSILKGLVDDALNELAGRGADSTADEIEGPGGDCEVDAVDPSSAADVDDL